MYYAQMRFSNLTTDDERSVFEAPLATFGCLLEQFAICEYYRGETVDTKYKPVTVHGEAYSMIRNDIIYSGTATFNGKGNVKIKIKDARQRTRPDELCEGMRQHLRKQIHG